MLPKCAKLHHQENKSNRKDVEILAYRLHVDMSINTFSKASSFPPQDLSCCKSLIIDLHTRDSSSEIPPVTDTGAHSHWVVSGESYPPDVTIRSKSSIDKELRSSCPLIVGRTNKLPSPWHDPPGYHCFGEAASSTTRKPYKQRPR